MSRLAARMFVLVLLLSIPIHADFRVKLAPVDNTSGNGDPLEPTFSSVTHQTFDLVVEVSGNDDVTSVNLLAELAAGSFFQAKLGGIVPPSAATIKKSPAAAFDTFFSNGEFAPGFAGTPVIWPDKLAALYFDSMTLGNGELRILRATMIVPPEYRLTTDPNDAPIARFWGTLTSINSGGVLFPFNVFLHARIRPLCTGDLNHDFAVTVEDIALLLAAFGVSAGGDLDGDGDTDQSDLGILLTALHDEDGDDVPDGCDLCPGFDDKLDADHDTVPDDCDACPGYNDRLDADKDGQPDACESCTESAFLNSETKFGYAVAAQGGTVAAGLPSPQGGVVQVYDKVGGTWVATEVLSAAPSWAGYFGAAISLDGDRLAIGAPGADPKDPSGFTNAGSVRVFRREPGGWKLEATLSLAHPAFGASVSLFDDRLLIGASQAYETRGAAFVYRREGSVWLLEAELDVSGIPKEELGFAVALEDDVAAVGGGFPRWFGRSPPGRVQLFQRVGASWQKLDDLKAPFPLDSDRFGYAVAQRGGRLIVGAPPRVSFGPARAYLYQWESKGFSLENVLTPVGGLGESEFASTVSLSSTRAAVGSPEEAFAGTASRGAVHLYELVEGKWRPHTYLSAEADTVHKRLGSSVAVWQDQVVSGAYRFNSILPGHVEILALAPGKCEP